MSARTTLKLLGISHNEKEWSAAELKAEGLKLQDLGRDLSAFMSQYGLKIAIARKTRGKS